MGMWLPPVGVAPPAGRETRAMLYVALISHMEMGSLYTAIQGKCEVVMPVYGLKAEVVSPVQKYRDYCTG